MHLRRPRGRRRHRLHRASAARSSPCSARTGPGRRPRWRRSRATRRPRAAASACSGTTRAHERRAVRRRTGVMLQDGGFAGELTVRETADLWAKLSRRDGDVKTDLDRLDLTGRADVPVQQLSGGETRRLEVALAIHGEPELLIFDEPTTGLDPESRRRTWQVIGELVDAGSTILLTTHYLEEAEALANRVAIMRDGRIAVAGSLGEVSARLPARIAFRAPAVPLPPELAGPEHRQPRRRARAGDVRAAGRPHPPARLGEQPRPHAGSPARPRRLARGRVHGGASHDRRARPVRGPDPRPQQARVRHGAAAAARPRRR